jgi:hypothetical protein
MLNLFYPAAIKLVTELRKVRGLIRRTSWKFNIVKRRAIQPVWVVIATMTPDSL